MHFFLNDNKKVETFLIKNERALRDIIHSAGSVTVFKKKSQGRHRCKIKVHIVSFLNTEISKIDLETRWQIYKN